MARRLWWGVLAALLLTFSPAGAGAQKITKGPYLQWVTPSSIYVVWEQDKASKPEIRYGLSKTYTAKATSSASAKRHEVKLSGLVPNTTYYYAVYQGNAKLSADLTLPTAVKAGTAFRFVVLGDTRTDKKAHTDVVTAISLEQNVRFYLNTGDLVSSGEIQSQWDEFFNIEKLLISHVPLFPVIGNHDEKSGKATLYKKLFVLPTNSPDPEEYYSFDYGNVHFLVLDGHVNVDEWYKCALKLKFYDGCFDEKQDKWLKADLKKAKANTKIDHIFVLVHMGPYSSKPGRMGYAQMRDLMPTFKSHGVTMVISGHDHYYEHGTSNNGIPYVISGGGGAPLYSIGKPSPLFPHKVIYNKSGYHYLTIDVNGKYVHVKAKSPKGVKMEEFYFNKPPIPPPKDAGVADAGTAADQAVVADSKAAADKAAAKADKAKGADQASTSDGPAKGADSASASADGKVATPPGDTGDDGCSCRAGGQGPGAGLGLLLAAMLLWVRRRRR